MQDADIAREWKARLPGLGELWSLTRGNRDVRIAVLDGPVDDAVVARDGARPAGVRDHGTHVYSVIAGSQEVPGIAPGCTVVPIPIFKADGEVCTQVELASAIGAAIQHGCSIINISAAQQGDLLALSSELNEALQDANDRDVLVVAATGNHGCACDTLPAASPNVLAVGAHGEDGVPMISSNWGPSQRAHGIVAPGREIPGACVGGGLCRASGTSFAAATVSGVAGLLMSVDAERGLVPSGQRTRKVLVDSSIAPPRDQVELASTYLSGRLDVWGAAKLLLGFPGATNRQENGSMEGTVNLEARPAMPVSADAIAPAHDAAAGPQPARPDGLAPCDCGCGGKSGECSCNGGGDMKPQFVYAIGRLGVSFISQARRDSIWRMVNGERSGDLKPISDASLRDLFKKTPFQAQSVIWTLSRSEVAMYAIVPTGAFAAETYRWLVGEWSDDAVEFVAIPGVLGNKVTLYDGQVVDMLVPDLRGMYSWETKKYVKAIADARKKAAPKMTQDAVATEVERFLGKIYYAIRNRGLSPQERALNAAATNAFNFSSVISEIGQDGLTLRDVSVERSPLNRPGSDYYDVLLTFFDPNDRLGHAPLRARFTIDVADTVPVMIGDPVTWHEY